MGLLKPVVRSARRPGVRIAVPGLVALLGWCPASPLVAGDLAVPDACAPYLYVPSTEVAAPDPPESFLLSVRRDGTPESFVLGTFHSADAGVRERWEPVVLLLGRPTVRRVFTERAADGPVVPGADPRLLPAGERLRDVLDGDDGPLAGHLARLLSSRGLPPDAYERYQPWVAAALVSQAPARRRGGGTILDDMVRARARALGVPASPLESLDELARAHEQGLSAADRRRMLAEAVCNAAQTARVVEHLTRAYMDNAPAAFMAEMGRLRSRDPAFESRVRRVLVAGRTARFWDQLAHEFDEGGVLVAVGNLHVSGAGGLAARLIAAGFRVEPIPPVAAVRPLDPDMLRDLSRWAGEWTVQAAAGPAAGTGPRVEPRSVVTLRRLLCGGRPCRVDGAYVPGDPSILLETGSYARLLRQRRDEETAYAESILVRELVRHRLLAGGEGAAIDTRWSQPGDPGTAQRSAYCRANRVSHRASRAQVAYLRERGVQARARIVPLSALCPEPEVDAP